MAKAHITTKSGASIIIEGTTKEVAELVSQLKPVGGTPLRGKQNKRKVAGQPKPILGDLIAELIDGGFFKKPKELGAIRNALEEQGHFYPATTLSPIMLRLVRRRQLRRIKDKKRWLYVG
jgi:hypothetical protein